MEQPVHVYKGNSADATAKPGQTAPTPKQPKLHRKHPIVKLVLALIVVAAIVAGGVFWFGSNTASKKEFAQVDSSRYQAVFLQSGQVYFGKIKSISPTSTTISDVYYLNVNSTNESQTTTTSSDNVSLVKLGCELHGPEDQMTIKNNQISFWENLKTDGQVTTAIGQWKEQNPNGQECSTTTGSTDQATGTETTTQE